MEVESRRPAGSESSTAIRKLLECPVCVEVNAEKIVVCQRGHRLCRACFNDLRNTPKTCPTCRGAFDNGPRRSLLAEELVASAGLDLRCKFARRGCLAWPMKYPQIVAHEKGCEFKGDPAAAVVVNVPSSSGIPASNPAQQPSSCWSGFKAVLGLLAAILGIGWLLVFSVIGFGSVIGPLIDPAAAVSVNGSSCVVAVGSVAAQEIGRLIDKMPMRSVTAYIASTIDDYADELEKFEPEGGGGELHRIRTKCREVVKLRWGPDGAFLSKLAELKSLADVVLKRMRRLEDEVAKSGGAQALFRALIGFRQKSQAPWFGLR